jgi:2-haloacid dehalogenase
VRGQIRACIFDVFGTVVDWRTSVSTDLARFAAERGIDGVDWVRFAVDWRKRYDPSMEEVRSGRRPWANLDVLHRESLLDLLADRGLHLDAREVDHLTRAWHRLDPWPDAVEGLTRLKARYVVAPCSNGHVALIVNMAKRGGLPWDVVLGAELAHAYKPQPETYLTACRLLDLSPEQVLMVAAHNFDLDHARACGLRTAFVVRPTERGPRQRSDLEAGPEVDVAATDFIDLAAQLGC